MMMTTTSNLPTTSFIDEEVEMDTPIMLVSEDECDDDERMETDSMHSSSTYGTYRSSDYYYAYPSPWNTVMMRTLPKELDFVEETLGMDCITTMEPIKAPPSNALRALRHGSKVLRMYGRHYIPMMTSNRYKKLTKMTLSDLCSAVVTEEEEEDIVTYGDAEQDEDVGALSDDNSMSTEKTQETSSKKNPWCTNETTVTDLRTEMRRQEKAKREEEEQKRKEMLLASTRRPPHQQFTRTTGGRGPPRRQERRYGASDNVASYATTAPRRSLLLGKPIASSSTTSSRTENGSVHKTTSGNQATRRRTSADNTETSSVTSVRTHDSSSSHRGGSVSSIGTQSYTSSSHTNRKSTTSSTGNVKQAQRLCKFGKRCRCASTTCHRSHTLQEWNPEMCTDAHHKHGKGAGETCPRRHAHESKEECLRRFVMIPNTFYHENRQIYLKTFRLQHTHHRK